MKRLKLALGLAIGLSLPLTSAAVPTPSKYEIALLEQKVVPIAGVDRAVLDAAASRAAASGSDKVHFLVQLYEVPDDARRSELGRRGVDLGGYVAGNAWMAALPAAEVRSLAEISEVRSVLPWTADRKQHPRVKQGDFGSWTRDPEHPDWVMLFVLLHHDVPLDRLAAIADRVGGAAMEPVAGLHGGTVWVPEGQVRELAEAEEVLWIEEGPLPLSPNNDGLRAATHVEPLFSAPYGLDGSGVKLFVFDGGAVRASHETFDAGAGSRVTVIDGSPMADHATHVAGTAAGDGSGSSAGRGRGIATGSTVFSAAYSQTAGTMFFWDNAGDLEADYAQARNFFKVDLGTNSLGANIAANGFNCAREGDYGVTSSLLDELVRGDATARGTMVMTWANGNERTGAPSPTFLPRGRCGSNYVTTGPPACAKNPIQVGAINSDGLSMTDFSSWGPCDDGRLKPVVSAPGCEQGRVTGETYIYSSLATNNSAYGGAGWCGTSMSTPGVAGIVSLFIEDWRVKTSLPKGRPLPALVKAFLIQTAKDLGQPGPDYIYGYGAVDAKAMIDTLRAGNGSFGPTGAPAVWGTDTIANGAAQSRRYLVPAGTAELKASLAWDDVAAAAFAANAPVNDLTLQLISPTLVTYNAFVMAPGSPHAEAQVGFNTLDNQEQVIVKNPVPGTWTIRVTATNVPAGPQTYGLVYTAKPAAFDPATCSTAFAMFESGNDGFNLSGAATAPAPGFGHGFFSLQLGGSAGSTHDAYRDFAIPAAATRAALSYYVYLTTGESATPSGFGWDHLTAEIRDTAGNVLAVVDNRSDGWKTGTWMRQFEVDLTPWAGSTVRVAFRAQNNGSNPTTFWVDDLSLETCSP